MNTVLANKWALQFVAKMVEDVRDGAEVSRTSTANGCLSLLACNLSAFCSSSTRRISPSASTSSTSGMVGRKHKRREISTIVQQSSFSVNSTLFSRSSRSSSQTFSNDNDAGPSFSFNLPTEVVLYILSIAALSSRESALAISRVASWTYLPALKGLYCAVVIHRWKQFERFSSSIVVNSNEHETASLGKIKSVTNKGSFVQGIWLVPRLLVTPPLLSTVQQVLNACPNLIDLAVPSGLLSAVLRSNVRFRHLTITTPAFQYDWDSGIISTFTGRGASVSYRSAVLNTLSNITHLIILRTDAASQFLPIAQMPALTHLAYPLVPLDHGVDRHVETSPEDMLARTEALGSAARQFLNAGRVNLEMLVLHFRGEPQRGRRSLRNFAQGLGLHFGRYINTPLHSVDSTSSEDNVDSEIYRSSALSFPQEARVLIRAAHACDPRVYALPLDFKNESSDADKIWEDGVRFGQSGVFAAAIRVFALCSSIGS